METAGHCPLATISICSKDTLYVGCMLPSVVVGPTTVGVLVVGHASSPVDS